MSYDLIIVGAGPAGITAGIYASRKKLKTLLIAKDFVGQTGLAFNVENYPGIEDIRGIELMQRFKRHLEKQEIEIKEGEAVEEIRQGFKVKTNKGNYLAKTVIVATGSKPRQLAVPGEKKFLGKGVAYCVTCDGPAFRGKTVIVIGGGNSGFGAGLELSRYCKKVYILHINDKLDADEALQERVRQNKKIEVVLNAKTSRIEGEKMVNKLVCKDVQSGEEKEIAADGVFIEIGYVPVADFFNDLVEFNERGEIIIDFSDNTTKTPGLFSAGDVSSEPNKQIIVAAASGCKAALSVYNYLQKNK